MTEGRQEAKFEGMVEARLAALEDRLDEVLDVVRGIESRVRAEQTTSAILATRIEELKEKTNFNLRAIWSAVAWICVAAAGMALAALGLGR